MGDDLLTPRRRAFLHLGNKRFYFFNIFLNKTAIQTHLETERRGRRGETRNLLCSANELKSCHPRACCRLYVLAFYFFVASQWSVTQEEMLLLSQNIKKNNSKVWFFFFFLHTTDQCSSRGGGKRGRTEAQLSTQQVVNQRTNRVWRRILKRESPSVGKQQMSINQSVDESIALKIDQSANQFLTWSTFQRDRPQVVEEGRSGRMKVNI